MANENEQDTLAHLQVMQTEPHRGILRANDPLLDQAAEARNYDQMVTLASQSKQAEARIAIISKAYGRLRQELADLGEELPSLAAFLEKYGRVPQQPLVEPPVFHPQLPAVEALPGSGPKPEKFGKLTPEEIVAITVNEKRDRKDRKPKQPTVSEAAETPQAVSDFPTADRLPVKLSKQEKEIYEFSRLAAQIQEGVAYPELVDYLKSLGYTKVNIGSVQTVVSSLKKKLDSPKTGVVWQSPGRGKRSAAAHHLKLAGSVTEEPEEVVPNPDISSEEKASLPDQPAAPEGGEEKK